MTPLARLATFALLGALTLTACSGNSEGTPTTEAPSETATAAPEVTATATGTSGPARPTPTPVSPVSVEGEYVIDGFELLVTSIPYNDRFPSDQFADRLDRVYRDWWGDLQVDVLISAEDLGAPIFRSQIIADPTGQKIVVAVCGRGDCGGFTPPEPGAMLTLHATTDGGRTWAPHGEVDAGSRLIGWHDGEVVIGTLVDRDSGRQTLRHFPSNRPFQVPDDAADGSSFVVDPATGEPLWVTRDGTGVVDATGDRRYELPEPGTGAVSGTPLPNGSIYWSWHERSRGVETITAAFDHLGRKLTPALAVPYWCCPFALLDGRPLAIEVRPLPESVDAYRDELPTTQSGEPYARPVPGALNPRNGAIHVIADPFLRTPYQDRDQIRIVAVVPPSPAAEPPPPSTSLESLDKVPGLQELVDAVLAGPHAVIERAQPVPGSCTRRGAITPYCARHGFPADHTFDAVIVSDSLHCAGCNIATEAVEAALARIYTNGGVEISAFWGGEDASEDRNVSAIGVELVRAWELNDATRQEVTNRWPDRTATHAVAFRALDPGSGEGLAVGFLLFVDLQEARPIAIVEPWASAFPPGASFEGWRTLYTLPEQP